MVGTVDESSPARRTRSSVAASLQAPCGENAGMMDIGSSAPSPLSPGSTDLLEDIFSNDEETCTSAVMALKSNIIGSNKQKQSIIERGVVPRLIALVSDPNSSASLKIVVAYTLGSIAKGLDSHLKALVDHGLVPVLIRGLNGDKKFVEACLCCLRTIFQSADAPHEIVYTEPQIVPHLINLMPLSTSNQVSVASIFANACKTREHQDYLSNHGLIPALNVLLCSPLPSVQLPALRCLAILVFGNENVARIMKDASLADGTTLLGSIELLMNRNKRLDIQLEAARCITYLFRCGVLEEDDRRITFKALPCVVRMTKKEECAEDRILAAETLAYLIEGSAELQRIAAISNRLIDSMATFLTWEVDSGAKDVKLQAGQSEQVTATARDMQRAAFRVYASLGANDEEIRKRIIETEYLLPNLVSALEDPNPKLQMAAIGCLHSLSRSVQLLRTTFQDHPVWKPLMKILVSSATVSNTSAASVEPLIVASSTLCNLLLEFSPSKEQIMEFGAIGMLCALTHKFEPALRLNGVWGLMNMAFQAEQGTKVQIIKSLEPDQIFRLLSDPDDNVVMKTLGLLRNILSNKAHIDHIMGLQDYGKQIMQAVVLILESDKIPEVKEQALCILGHIADGATAKNFIMSNEDVLKKVTNYMTHHNTKLRIAAVFIVQNLVWSGDAGAAERQAKLKDIGVYKILQQLLATTADSTLATKVKSALDQFS